MAKFIVDLSDNQRELLEAYRRRTGERSLSDAVRKLIEATGGTSAPSLPPAEATLTVRAGAAALAREGAKFQADMDADTAKGLDLPLGQTRRATPKSTKRS